MTETYWIKKIMCSCSQRGLWLHCYIVDTLDLIRGSILDLYTDLKYWLYSVFRATMVNICHKVPLIVEQYVLTASMCHKTQIHKSIDISALTTVEGIIDRAVEGLNQDQVLRRVSTV